MLGENRPMEKPPAIRSLLVRNLLSFGETTPAIELQGLNVLIGPNGSGKSNLIEIMGLLQSTPRAVSEPIYAGGGVAEWLWKGASERPRARIEVVASPQHGCTPLRYCLEFTRSGPRLEITDERIEDHAPPRKRKTPRLYFGYVNGRPVLNVHGEPRELRREDVNPDLSILSQLKDPAQYPELTYLGRLFENIQLYRNWEFGAASKVRDAWGAGLPNNVLHESATNLGVVLDRLLAYPKINRELVDYLRMFHEDTETLHTPIRHGVVEIALEEKYLKSTVPAKRLSDGTLRWIALLTILLNPEPPPLVCIEEPELGLHPDMIHEVAKLLLMASERMQLIVTTHSDLLVEEFSENPEVVVVCEKERGATKLRRLDKRELGAWLKRYSLGQLWRKGQIGGNRW
jgi:predicted ATPase